MRIGAACGGIQAAQTFRDLADHLIATEPSPELVSEWNQRSGPVIGQGARAIGQVSICWDPDADHAVHRAHDQFRWFAGRWSVNSDLPTPAGFAAATAFVREDDVAESIACGPDLDAIVDGLRPFWEAGFTDIAVVQVGDERADQFLTDIARFLLDRLRSASPA